jgi:hypothetical protein
LALSLGAIVASVGVFVACNSDNGMAPSASPAVAASQPAAVAGAAQASDPKGALPAGQFTVQTIGFGPGDGVQMVEQALVGVRVENHTGGDKFVHFAKFNAGSGNTWNKPPNQTLEEPHAWKLLKGEPDGYSQILNLTLKCGVNYQLDLGLTQDPPANALYGPNNKPLIQSWLVWLPCHTPEPPAPPKPTPNPTPEPTPSCSADGVQCEHNDDCCSNHCDASSHDIMSTTTQKKYCRTPPPVDLCWNIPGNQETMPANMTSYGGYCSCVSGYHLEGAVCVVDSCKAKNASCSADSQCCSRDCNWRGKCD